MTQVDLSPLYFGYQGLSSEKGKEAYGHKLKKKIVRGKNIFTPTCNPFSDILFVSLLFTYFSV